MKFKSNKLVAILFLSAMIVFSTSNIMAYQTSGTRVPYQSEVGKWNYISPSYSLSSQGAPVKGTDTAVYFSSLGYLETYFVADSSRKVRVQLWEEDFGINSDDHVKTYVLSFKGRTVSGVESITTHLPGAIEDTNDKTAELYLYQFIDKKTGDSTTFKTLLYNFEIRVN